MSLDRDGDTDEQTCGSAKRNGKRPNQSRLGRDKARTSTEHLARRGGRGWLPVCPLSAEQPGGGGPPVPLRHQGPATGGCSLLHLLTESMITTLGHLKAVCKQITCKVPHSGRAGSNCVAPFRLGAFAFVPLSLLCAARRSSEHTRMELRVLAASGSTKFAENGRNRRNVGRRASRGLFAALCGKGL